MTNSKPPKNLTLTLGLRFDYQGCLSEAHGSQSTFDPLHSEPRGWRSAWGRSSLPATGTGRTGKKCFEKPPKDAWGPRFGFAYRIDNKPPFAVDTGSITEASRPTSFPARPNSASPPTQRFRTSPMASPPLSIGTQASLRLSIKLPPTISPSVANGGNPTWITANRNDLPRYQNYSLTLERQVGTVCWLELLIPAITGLGCLPLPSALGLLDNMNNPSVLSLGGCTFSGLTSTPPAAIAAGIQLPYPGFVGDVAQALRPWPQYTNLNVLSVPLRIQHLQCFHRPSSTSGSRADCLDASLIPIPS